MVIVTGNLVAPLGTSVVFGQMPTAISPMLNPVGSLLSTDAVPGAKPESSSETPARGDRVADAVASSKIGLVATNGIHADLQSARARISLLLAESTLDDFPGPNGDHFLMGAALPFDRAAFERAVDQFFEQLEELDGRDLVDRGLPHLALISLGLTTSAAAFELARRRFRRRTSHDGVIQVRWTSEDADDVGLPDLPGSWSSGLT